MGLFGHGQRGSSTLLSLTCKLLLTPSSTQSSLQKLISTFSACRRWRGSDICIAAHSKLCPQSSIHVVILAAIIMLDMYTMSACRAASLYTTGGRCTLTDAVVCAFQFVVMAQGGGGAWLSASPGSPAKFDALGSARRPGA